MLSQEIQALTDEQLAGILRGHNALVGPITVTTRLVYERKLARIRSEMPPVQLSTELEEEEDFEEEEEEEEIVSPRPQYTSPLASKISGSYSSNYGSSPIIGGHLSSSLTRRSLDSVRDRSYTGLRKSSASSAPPAKKGMSLIMNLLIILVLGFIAWMVYINFEAAGRRPSLTTSS